MHVRFTTYPTCCNVSFSFTSLYIPVYPLNIYEISFVELTINPGYCNAFKECNPQKAHTTGCIVVKELKHIHATLKEEEEEKEDNRGIISHLSPCTGFRLTKSKDNVIMLEPGPGLRAKYVHSSLVFFVQNGTPLRHSAFKVYSMYDVMEQNQATVRLSKEELKHKTVTLLVTGDLGMRF